MAFNERKDFGVRIAAEKAQKPDEVITRSQLEAGTNIQFEYLPAPSHNIRISSTAAGGDTGTPIRQLHGMITISLLPGGGDGQGHTQANFFYGTTKYLDVYHNWNLPTKDAFVCQLVDHASGISTSVARHSTPKVVGIDVNTARIWANYVDPFQNAVYRITIMEKV